MQIAIWSRRLTRIVNVIDAVLREGRLFRFSPDAGPRRILSERPGRKKGGETEDHQLEGPRSPQQNFRRGQDHTVRDGDRHTLGSRQDRQRSDWHGGILCARIETTTTTTTAAAATKANEALSRSEGTPLYLQPRPLGVIGSWLAVGERQVRSQRETPTPSDEAELQGDAGIIMTTPTTVSISSASVEYGLQGSELLQDAMPEEYDPGEGPSNGNLQNKCSICDFATFDRQDMIQHLTNHIVSRNNNNNSLETINVVLSQLRYLHNQDNPPSRNDGQEDSNRCVEESGMMVPRMNSQGRMKTFPCKSCDFKAVTKLDYWGHIRMHIKPTKLMSCYKCPFVTEYKHHLEYHLLNHSGAKPYKCSICTYTCVNKSMLNSHMKSHSSIYQFRCRDCEYATKYCHTLKQHLRKYNHQPAAVLNVDGTLSPMVIDVYGTRRGPKQRPKNSNRAAATATITSAEEPSASTSTATQTTLNNDGSSISSSSSSSSSSSNDPQQPMSMSPQALPSTSTQALPSTSASSTVPAQFTLGMLAGMLNSRKNNLLIQKDEQTGQETVHYPFNYNHPIFTMGSQFVNGRFVLKETARRTPTPSDEAELQNPGDAGVIMTTPTTVTADESDFLEDLAIENSAIPLDLTSSSLRNEASTSQSPCQQSPLNLANSPKVGAGTRRRKGIAIKLEHRIVEKEEDTDEETTPSEKRLCQSTSPQAASAPTISQQAALGPSTSPQAASTPSFMTASIPSTSLMAASSTAPSSTSGNCGVDAAGSAGSSQQCEEMLAPESSNSQSSSSRFACAFCDILYPNQTIYIAHTRYHGSAEPFTCNMCGTSCTNRDKFNLHIFECLKQQ